MPDRTSSPKSGPGSGHGPTSRRDEILGVAASVFARKGVASATVRDIADEANILSGSLYHHFESKDQMVEEILRAGFEALSQGYSKALADADSPADAIRRLLRAGITFVMHEPVVGTIIRDSRYIQEQPRFSFVVDYKREFASAWMGLLEDGIAEGAFRGDLDVEVAYYAIVDAILGSVRYAGREDDSEIERIAGRLGELFVRSLTAL